MLTACLLQNKTGCLFQKGKKKEKVSTKERNKIYFNRKTEKNRLLQKWEQLLLKLQ